MGGASNNQQSPSAVLFAQCTVKLSVIGVAPGLLEAVMMLCRGWVRLQGDSMIARGFSAYRGYTSKG